MVINAPKVQWPFMALLFVGLLAGCVAPVVDLENGDTGLEVAPTLDETPVPAALPPDLTGESFRVVQFGNMTRRGSEFVLPAIRGVEDFVEFVNDEGGIFGAIIELETLDSFGDTSHVELAIRNWQASERPTFLILHDVEIANELQDVLRQLQIPTLTSFVSEVDEDDYLIGVLPAPEIELLHLMGYLVENWEGVRPSNSVGGPALAVLYWPDFYGTSALTECARRALPRTGAPLVYEAEINASYAEDVMDQLRAARRAGANVIYVQGFAFGPAVVLDDLYWLGMQEEMLVAGPSAALDNNVYGYLTRPEYFDGFYAATSLAWWSDEGNSGIILAEELFKVNDRTPADRVQARLMGHAMVDLIRQSITEAVGVYPVSEFSGGALQGVVRELGLVNLVDGLLLLGFDGAEEVGHYLRIRQVSGLSEFTLLTSLEPYLEK